MLHKSEPTGLIIPISLLGSLLVLFGCGPGEKKESRQSQEESEEQESEQDCVSIIHGFDPVTNDPSGDRKQKFQLVKAFTDRSGGEKQVPFKNVRVRIQNNRGAKRSKATVYLKGKKVHTIERHQFSKLYAIKHGDTGYLFIEMWTGGMHCCFPVSVYSVSSSRTQHLKTFELGHANFDPERDLFTRSGHLYYRMLDTRFAYFHVSFASSIFYDRYFRITPDHITERNQRFRDAYLAKAKRHRECFMDVINASNEKYDSSIVDTAMESWLPQLLGYTVNLIMAGKSERAWDGFHRLYGKMRSRHPTWVEDTQPSELKRAIQSKLPESD